MGRLAYFADLPNGETLEWRPTSKRTQLNNGMERVVIIEPKVSRCLQTWPAVGSGNELCGFVPERGWTRITRTVELKSNPSRHGCDARCLNARGRSMNCECSCAGRNHGRGAPVCEAA